MEWFLKVVRDNYATFSGRARRKEYWLFYLAYFILAVIAICIDAGIGARTEAGIGVFSTIIPLALALPSCAVSVRRLHDTNRKAWWLLMNLLPVIGWIWLWVLFCFKGMEGENRFGPDPLAPENA